MSDIHEPEITELLGAYALDAVDDDERAAVERHLATCPRCRAEVATHREVAAMLGSALATDDGRSAAAPAGLWERIADSLEEEPPALAPVVRPPAWRRRGPIVAVGAVAAGLLLAIGLLGGQIAHLNHQVGDLKTALARPAIDQQVSHALEDPRHQVVALTATTTNQVAAQVVVLPDGSSYFLGHSLAHLGAGRTYQLWALADGKVVSLGVLGPRPDAVATRLERGMTRLMVTVEPTGGTPAPTTPVLMAGKVPVRL